MAFRLAYRCDEGLPAREGWGKTRRRLAGGVCEQRLWHLLRGQFAWDTVHEYQGLEALMLKHAQVSRCE
jgi:hypothetical protein